MIYEELRTLEYITNPNIDIFWMSGLITPISQA